MKKKKSYLSLLTINIQRISVLLESGKENEVVRLKDSWTVQTGTSQHLAYLEFVCVFQVGDLPVSRHQDHHAAAAEPYASYSPFLQHTDVQHTVPTHQACHF